MRIKNQKNTPKNSTDDSSSFIMFINCFINHFLTLLFRYKVVRYDLIHPVRHLGDFSLDQVVLLL